MITVVLPSSLRIDGSDRLEVHDEVKTVAELVDAIDRRIPGFREQLEDSVFNFAVNDELLLFRARDHGLRDGDVVEVVPTISGGAAADHVDVRAAIPHFGVTDRSLRRTRRREWRR